MRTKILVGVTLVAAVALVVVLQSKNDQPKDSESSSSASKISTNEPAGGGELDARKGGFDALSPTMTEVAKTLKNPIQSLREAALNNTLPSRSLELPDALGAPRSPDAFIGAFKGELSPNIGSFEWTMLAGALLKATGASSVSYGYDAQSPSQSVLEHRIYAVKGPDGIWHAQTGSIEGKERIRTMKLQDVQANGLAWSAMDAATVGDLDRASQAIGKARKLAPEDPAIAFTEGRIQLASDLRERGWNTLDRVAGEQKTDAQAFVTIGELALGLKAPFRATRAFQSALAIDPDFGPALLGLSQVEMERLLVTPESEKGALKAQIESRLDKVASAPKKDSDYWAVRADLAQLEKNEELRRTTLEEGMKTNPSSLLAVLNMVQFHMEKQAIEAALAAGLRGHAGGVRDPRLSTQLGVLHFELVGQVLADTDQSGLGDDSKRVLEGALKHLKEAKKLAPEQRDIRLMLSQVTYLSGDEKAGKMLLDEQAKLFPKDTEGLLVSAQLAMKESDFKRAKRLLNKVFTLEPKHRDAAAVNYLLAIISDGDVLAARKKALELGYPRQVLGQSVLEAIHVDARGAEEVLALMDEELDENPTSIEAINLKAVALTLLEKDVEAEKLIDEAVALIPEENRENLRQALKAQLEQAKLALKTRKMLKRQAAESNSEADANGDAKTP